MRRLPDADQQELARRADARGVVVIGGDGTTISRLNLPGPVLDEWPIYRKRVATPALPLRGPVTVMTADGRVDLPEGWRGWLAIDAAGAPYPVNETEFARIYEPVVVP